MCSPPNADRPIPERLRKSLITWAATRSGEPQSSKSRGGGKEVQLFDADEMIQGMQSEEDEESDFDYESSNEGAFEDLIFDVFEPKVNTW